MGNEYYVELNDLLKIFEDSIFLSDVIASKVLGEISAAVIKKKAGLGFVRKLRGKE